jgi:hypothetical protein
MKKAMRGLDSGMLEISGAEDVATIDGLISPEGKE